MSHLFLLGPAKTASTSLAYWLSQHSSFCVSDPKESRYFEFEYHKDIDYYYEKYFSHIESSSQICVDANPMHLVVEYVIKRIALSICDPKFIVVLRNPFERAYSDWYNWSSMRPGRAIGDFDQAISDNLNSLDFNKFNTEGSHVPFCDVKGGSYKPTYIEASLYANLVSKYLLEFNKESFLFIDFDDLILTPQNSLDRISNFMSVDCSVIMDYSEVNMTIKNHKTIKQSKVKEFLSANNYNRLNGLFYEDSLRLSAITGVDYVSRWELI